MKLHKEVDRVRNGDESITVEEFHNMIQLFNKGVSSSSYIMNKMETVVWDSVSIRHAQKEEEYYMDEFLGGSHE